MSGEEFAKHYAEISASPDKVPLASTILSVIAIDGGTYGKILAWIFFEQDEKPRPQSTAPKTSLEI